VGPQPDAALSFVGLFSYGGVMKVMVKKDSATVIQVDCGEGEAGKARLQKLLEIHGASSVTQEDGSPVPVDQPAPKVAAKPPQPSQKKGER
jgi:hypothetical protein